MNIIIFGDSIVLGLWDENGGWVGRLTKDLVKKALTSSLELEDEARVNPIPWAADFSYRSKFVKQYDAIVRAVCRKNNIFYLGIFDNLMKSGFIEMLADGVHPNNRGHDMIFKVVGEKLLNLIVSQAD